MKLPKHVLNLSIIIILGLIPFLWLNNNSLIMGHDSGLTLFPVSHFLDRLSIWTDRYGFGMDQSFALSGFMIHGLEAIVSGIGFTIQTVQKIIFSFWLILPGIAMYIFASKIERENKLKYFALPASLLYMFNHFLLQGWFIAERTKFSLYAALPLMLYLLFEYQAKKMSALRTSILFSLLFFFLNGEGSLPLFGGIIVSIIIFGLFYFLEEHSLKSVKSLLKLSILTLFFSFILQAYWIIPYAQYVLFHYSAEVTTFGGVQGILGWIDYISKDSSLINLFRLQGIPEWYENPIHPYAATFLTNPLFILISFILPVSAFLPLRIIKDKRLRKLILFFSTLAVFSIIFIAGSHPPFGALYIAMAKFIPGFIAFRTPFYKFAPALWLSYAVLISITINYIITGTKEGRLTLPKHATNVLTKISKAFDSKLLAIPLFIIICLTILIYNFPFFTGVFFNYAVGQRSTRVHVPRYVFDYAKWSQTNDNQLAKTLTIPPQ